MSTVYRILGPNHNRLLTVTEDPKRHLGQVDHATADKLMAHGWTRYVGTGNSKAGWVIPGTDRNLRPRRVQVS